MGKIIKILFASGLVVLYFLLFNLIASFDFSLSPLNVSRSNSELVNAAFGDSVAITTFRDGLFWDQKTFHYTTHKDSFIYFAGAIRLPTTIRNINLFYIHLISLILFILLFLKMLLSERRYYE